MKLNRLEEFLTVQDIINGSPTLLAWSIFKNFENVPDEDIEANLKTLLTDTSTEADYYLSRLDKSFSVMEQRLIDYYKGQFPTATNLEILGYATGRLYGIVKDKYLKNWNYLTKSLYANYNPIQNYDMTEHKEEDNDKSVNTDMKTETSETQKYAGFNSGVSLPVASESEGESTTTGLKANNKQIDDNEYTLTRSGNIGVTTSQQMIESEIALRRKTLLDIIYNDIDKILFLNYYG